MEYIGQIVNVDEPISSPVIPMPMQSIVLKILRKFSGFFSHNAAITCGGLDPEDNLLDTCLEFNPVNNR
jgi:hypothetical protein